MIIFFAGFLWTEPTAVISDANDVLYITDYHRVTRVLYSGYMYFAEPKAGTSSNQHYDIRFFVTKQNISYYVSLTICDIVLSHFTL